MKLIPLTQGKFAKVDDEDYDYLMQFKWQAQKCKKSDTYYAVCSVLKKDKRFQNRMHRVILGITDANIHVDHIDMDGLNCQRNNMRIATRSQNSANRKRLKNCIGKYKGVDRNIHKNGKIYYRASCKKDGKTYYLSAKSEVDAAIKYNQLAVELHGEFANLNIIEEKNSNFVLKNFHYIWRMATNKKQKKSVDILSMEERYPRTISQDLHDAWQVLRRSGDPERMRKKIKIKGKVVSRPILDRALNLGHVKNPDLAKKITAFFDDRLAAEKSDGKVLLKSAIHQVHQQQPQPHG